METMERVCTDHAEPSNIVIFGAAGDLTKRKLIPALLKMIRCGLVNRESKIIGVVNNRTEQEWLEMIRTSIDKYASSVQMDDQQWQQFSAMLSMVPGDLGHQQTYVDLAQALHSFDGQKNALFYCAIPPQWYAAAAEGLESAGLVGEDEGYRRLVITLERGHTTQQDGDAGIGRINLFGLDQVLFSEWKSSFPDRFFA